MGWGKAIFCLLSLSFVFFSCTGSEKKDRYRIARDPTWYPLHLDGREKNLLAFSDDLLREIAYRQGVQFHFVQAGPSVLEQGLQRGDFDAALASWQMDAFKKARFVFSDPYFFTGEVLVVPTGSTTTGLANTPNRRVGILRGQLTFHSIEGDDTIDYKQYETLTSAIESMLRGDVDAVIMNLIPASALMRGIYGSRIKIVGSPLTESGIRVVVKKGENDPLITLFNEGLQELIKDGTALKLREKWGLWQQGRALSGVLEDGI